MQPAKESCHLSNILMLKPKIETHHQQIKINLYVCSIKYETCSTYKILGVLRFNQNLWVQDQNQNITGNWKNMDNKETTYRRRGLSPISSHKGPSNAGPYRTMAFSTHDCAHPPTNILSPLHVCMHLCSSYCVRSWPVVSWVCIIAFMCDLFMCSCMHVFQWRFNRHQDGPNITS